MNKDLSPWDFDDDGIVDRLLILHSANPQEIGGGASSIWSHMSGLDNPIVIDKWSINHYIMVAAGLSALVGWMTLTGSILAFETKCVILAESSIPACPITLFESKPVTFCI